MQRKTIKDCASNRTPKLKILNWVLCIAQLEIYRLIFSTTNMWHFTTLDFVDYTTMQFTRTAFVIFSYARVEQTNKKVNKYKILRAKYNLYFLPHTLKQQMIASLVKTKKKRKRKIDILLSL